MNDDIIYNISSSTEQIDENGNKVYERFVKLRSSATIDDDELFGTLLELVELFRAQQNELLKTPNSTYEQ